MRSLDHSEALDWLGRDAFAVSIEQVHYSRRLHRTGRSADAGTRIGRFFDPAPGQIAGLVLAMADWLPRHAYRLLWIDSFDPGYPSCGRAFLRVLGEGLATDHLVSQPGILIGPLSDDMQDQLAGTGAEQAEAEGLVALCALLCMGDWHAKLLSPGATDYVEFWEGNVFFWSEDAAALQRAEVLFDFWGLGTEVR